jgi:hypothetical protein
MNTTTTPSNESILEQFADGLERIRQQHGELAAIQPRIGRLTCGN